MHRFILRAVYAARSPSVGVFESCVSPVKCDKAAALRVASGVRALSTSSVRLCEKTNDVTSSSQGETAHANKEADATETPTPVTQKAEDDSKVMETAEQTEEPAVLKTDDGAAAQQQTDVNIEQVSTPPIKLKTEVIKSGKEGLLDLLGAMKVEVTNKRKLKNLKVKQNYVSTPKTKPEAMESTISMFQKATEESSPQSETLDPELVSAASAAASTLPNSSLAESELLKKLRQHEAVTEAQKKGDMKDLGVIIADMRVGKQARRQSASPANQIQFDDDGRGYKQSRGITDELDGVRMRKNLFSGKRLNIFPSSTDDSRVESVARPTLWDIDHAYQLSQVTSQIHRNSLEEMIQWTKEGKMWQYPINNEAGLEEEAAVSFHEHIFLEKHLGEGFPRDGPVRHFMELVVAGLSKNPYLTVQQKKEHISWFRDYFHQKEEVLKEADIYLN